MNMISKRAIAGVLALTVGLGAMSVGLMPANADAQSGGSDKKMDQPTDTQAVRRVTIIFRTGNQITGDLLSETETAVKVRIEVAGMKAETEYNKADILEMKDLPKPATTDSDNKKDAKSDKKPKDDGNIDSGNKDLEKTKRETGIRETKDSMTRADASEAGGPRVYLVEMIGVFGHDVNVTPMEEVYQDIKLFQPDVVVVKFSHEFVAQGEKKADTDFDRGAFDQLEIARRLADIFRLRLETDAGFKVKPRLVAWIDKALGAAAFLPFVCKDIYFTTEGKLGGIGYLDFLFAGRGDEVVREKQRSLRLARAEGLAQLGGHDSRIMRAMSRMDYVMSVSFKDGVPVFHERMPENADETLLTDDGVDKNQDIFQDIIRGKGNDVLTLGSDMAFRIGLSKGTADTLDDLMDRMGLPRNYQVVKGKGSQIIKTWGKNVSDAEGNITRLIRELRRQEVKAPGGYKERTEYRGRRKAILRQIQSILRRYQESIDPEVIGEPEGTINTIDRLITELDADQQADKDRR